MLDPIQTKKLIEKRIDKTLKEISEKLDEIETHFPSLSDDEVAFVKARKGYLTPKQQQIFKDLFKKVETK